MSTHTPGPFYVNAIGKQRYIETKYQNALTPFIADIQFPDCQSDEERETAEANAAYIVRACNAHEELVEACKAAYVNVEGNPALEQALKAAIAKAERRA